MQKFHFAFLSLVVLSLFSACSRQSAENKIKKDLEEKVKAIREEREKMTPEERESERQQLEAQFILMRERLKAEREKALVFNWDTVQAKYKANHIEQLWLLQKSGRCGEAKRKVQQLASDLMKRTPDQTAAGPEALGVASQGQQICQATQVNPEGWSAEDLSRAGRHEEAIKLYEARAEGGESIAYYSLGEMYLSGKGVSQNPEKGIKLLETAFKLGERQAAVRLGQIYRYGDKVPKDDRKSRHWSALAGKPSSEPNAPSYDKDMADMYRKMQEESAKRDAAYESQRKAEFLTRWKRLEDLYTGLGLGDVWKLLSTGKCDEAEKLIQANRASYQKADRANGTTIRIDQAENGLKTCRWQNE